MQIVYTALWAMWARYIICDPLRENRSFAKMIQNVLEARKVTVVKNGLLD